MTISTKGSDKPTPLTEGQTAIVHRIFGEHIYALKNWIATAVENGDTEKAQEYVRELRECQIIYSVSK